MLILELPWPPSVNHYWVASGHRRYISRKGIEFRKCVLVACQDNDIKFDGPVSITIGAYPPDRRKRDLDNILKGLLDSLEYAEIYKNDNQVARLFIERKEIEKPGKVIVGIKNYDAMARD